MSRRGGGRRRDIAAAIGHCLGILVAPVAAEQVWSHFGHLSAFVGLDNPKASEVIRTTFGWTPIRPGLLTDFDDASGGPVAANPPSNG